MPPPGRSKAGRAVEWQNRRERAGGLQFSDSGNELLYPAGGDLFLIHVDTGKWGQLTKTPVAETDPKLSPDGKTVAFRRGQDLYTVDGLGQGNAPHPRRHGDAAQRRARLGLPGRTGTGHGVLVVAGFEVHRLLAVRYQP